MASARLESIPACKPHANVKAPQERTLKSIQTNIRSFVTHTLQEFSTLHSTLDLPRGLEWLEAFQLSETYTHKDYLIVPLRPLTESRFQTWYDGMQYLRQPEKNQFMLNSHQTYQVMTTFQYVTKVVEQNMFEIYLDVYCCRQYKKTNNAGMETPTLRVVLQFINSPVIQSAREEEILSLWNSFGSLIAKHFLKTLQLAVSEEGSATESSKSIFIIASDAFVPENQKSPWVEQWFAIDPSIPSKAKLYKKFAKTALRMKGVQVMDSPIPFKLRQQKTHGFLYVTVENVYKQSHGNPRFTIMAVVTIRSSVKPVEFYQYRQAITILETAPNTLPVIQETQEEHAFSPFSPRSRHQLG